MLQAAMLEAAMLQTVMLEYDARSARDSSIEMRRQQ
jgi:hypothetical protein